MAAISQKFKNLSLERRGSVFIITLGRAPENRFDAAFCQEIIRAFHSIQKELSASEGAVITRGSDCKFFTTGLELEDVDPWQGSDGFYPVCHSNITFSKSSEDQ